MTHHVLTLRILEGTAVALGSWLAARAVRRGAPVPQERARAGNVAAEPIEQARDPLLKAFYEATEAGVDHVYAAEILGRLTSHETPAVARHEPSTLYPRVVSAVVTAASGALWPSYDAGNLVLALQDELDARGELAIPYVQRVIALVHEGWTASELLTAEGELAVPKTQPC